MTAIAELNVIPVRKGSMSGEIAKAVEALEAFDITYETTPMGTILEANDVHELFAAAEVAHEAVDEDRVITTLKIDDKRTVQQRASEKVTAVEDQLGREARRGD
ncbi:MAG: MTH1187 family thiamine-binding protein [Haloarculaceae archaeon]